MNDADTLLLLRFDGNTLGVGGETPTVEVGTSFQAGLVDQAVHIGSPGSIQFNQSGNINSASGTIEFWIKPDWNGNANETHVFFEVGQGFNNGMLLLIDGANNLRFIQWGDDPTTPSIETAVERGVGVSGADWPANEWRHFAASWDGATGMYALYVDGQLVGDASNGVQIQDFADDTMTIGAANSAFPALAAFDEFRISTRVRSASEILASYNLGLGLPLPLPVNQRGIALNHAVHLSWEPVVDPANRFDHYAIYRGTSTFDSIASMTPIATISNLSADSYVDSTSLNGTTYYYAVTAVDTSGEETTEVETIGPRKPRDETDLQVVSISRPEFPRYDAQYTFSEITEPSGFGPYYFSASTSLGSGQTFGDQRFPNLAEPVTYTATIRNRGTNAFNGVVQGVWKLDGNVVSSASATSSLAPDGTMTFQYVLPWDNESHELTFSIDVNDSRSANNTLTSDPLAVPFLTYIERSFVENWRDTFTLDPATQTDDILDWLNRQMARFNEMFGAWGVQKRVHYGVLEVIEDGLPSPPVDRSPYAMFPGPDFDFRYAADHDPSFRFDGYDASIDISYSLLHEWGHQLGLIDTYNLNVDPSGNQLTGQIYRTAPDLMAGSSTELSEFSALAMEQWSHYAHGYFGQYLYDLPEQLQLRFLGHDGLPLSGAEVKVYQYVNRPGLGPVITDQIKFQGVTSNEGVFALPNVPLNHSLIPAVGTGEVLPDNPFGYVDVGGSNGTFYIRVDYDGITEYTWLDIGEANVAYWKGHTSVATFDRHLTLGGAAGDYDRDGDVDGSDFLVWQRGLGGVATPAGSGADGDQSGHIDTGDLDVWMEHFGSAATAAAARGNDAEDLAHVTAITNSARSARDSIFAVGDFASLFAVSDDAAQKQRGRIGRRFR